MAACPECNGRGWVTDARLSGAKSTVKDQCFSCGGSGVDEQSEEQE